MHRFLSSNISKISNDIFIIIFIVIIPLLGTSKTPDNFIVIKFTVLSFILFLYSIFGYFNSTKNTKLAISKFTLLVFSLLLTFLIIVGLGLFKTVNITDGLLSFFKIFLLFSFTYVLYINNSDSKSFLSTIFKGFTILAFIILVIGMFQIINLQISNSINHNNLYEISSRFGHKNIFSQVLLICLPFSFFSILSKKLIWKVLGVFNTFSISFLLTILMTRSVWVAGLGSLIVTLTIGFFTLKASYFKLKKISVMLFSLITIAIITVFVYTKFDQSDAFKKQITKIFNFKYGSTKDRIILWEKSIELAKEKPLLGHGPGSWKVNILKYGNQNLRSEDNLTFYQRPHNDYIWVLCEQGTIGLVVYLLIFLLIIYGAIKLLQNEINKDTKLFITLLIFSLTSYVIFSFFSFPLERIEFIIFLAPIFAFLMILKDSSKNKPKSILIINSRLITIFISIVLFVSFLYGLSRFSSEIHLKKSYQARINKNWNIVISEIDKSQTAIYKIDPFSTPLEWYKGLANFNLSNYKDANINFSEAYIINPFHIHVLNNLATCKAMEKEYNKALILYEKSLEIAPSFEDAAYNICGIYQLLNEVDPAIKCIKKVKHPINIERYNKVVTILTKLKLRDLLNKNKEEKIKNYINLVIETNSTILEIFHESVEKNISIEKQVLQNTQYLN